MKEKPRLITVNRASEILSCHPKTVRRLIDEKKLTGLKVKNCLRITAASIDAYINEQILKYQLKDGIVDGEEGV